ncbi:hypothetical protein SDC9_63314 [bioreactor metagenome]|uniref:Uncharacterized protein n=1 Tax=bioreactor metagenome TaxID=1076179 RepID=A0A644XL65_9ZZZZ
MFRRPCSYVGNPGIKFNGVLTLSLNTDSFCSGGNRFSRRIQQFVSDFGIRRTVVVVADGGFQFKNAVLVTVVESGFYTEIAERSFGLRPQKYIAFDTADAPKVLAFKVRSC